MDIQLRIKWSFVCRYRSSGLICIAETFDHQHYNFFVLTKKGNKDKRYNWWSGVMHDDIEILSEIIPSTIAVDFDETLCLNGKLGAVCEGKLVEWVAKLIRILKLRGWLTILWTCREDENLTAAMDFCKRHDVPIDFYNENPIAVQFFTGITGKTLSKPPAKIWADVYLDDAAVSSHHPFTPQQKPIYPEQVDVQNLADLFDEWVAIRRSRWNHFGHLSGLETWLKQETTRVSTQKS